MISSQYLNLERKELIAATLAAATKMKGISTSVIALVVVAVIVVAGVGYYLVSQQGGQPSSSSTTSTSTTSTTSTSSSSSSTTQAAIPPGARNAFDKHLSNFDARDVPTTLNDYVATAVVLWTGNTGGLSGT